MDFPTNFLYSLQHHKKKHPDAWVFFWDFGAPREIRTLVLALKGLRPGPLDDGGAQRSIFYQMH